MSDVQNENQIDVFESKRFASALKKLSKEDLSVVEDSIDIIIENPMIGEKKKGDLEYLRVYKFLLNNQQVLLGYSFIERELNLTLLHLGAHENFYRDAKNRRKSDLKLISER